MRRSRYFVVYLNSFYLNFIFRFVFEHLIECNTILDLGILYIKNIYQQDYWIHFRSKIYQPLAFLMKYYLSTLLPHVFHCISNTCQPLFKQNQFLMIIRRSTLFCQSSSMRVSNAVMLQKFRNSAIQAIKF